MSAGSTKAFTSIELLLSLSILVFIISLSANINNIKKYYYYHKTQHTIDKLNYILNTTKNLAVISNKPTALCPFDFNIKQCSNDWHNPIIIFYEQDYKTLLSGKNNINNKKILFVYKKILSKTEDIFSKKFTQKKYIVYNQHGNNNIQNASFFYSNLYYNRNTKLNKAGQVN